MRNRIKDFTPGDKAVLILRLTDIQIKKTPANADYASMIGFDGTDLIEVKIWKLLDEQRTILSNGEIYEVTGTMKDYQGKMQFNVSELKLISEENSNFPLDERKEFYEYAKISEEDLKKDIFAYVSQIENENIRKLIGLIFDEHSDEYFRHPAAMSMHHNYISGLAYHVLSMLTLSDSYLKWYPYLNKSLVYGGIILHDIGKLVELSGPIGTEYTKEGNLLGHIALGSNILYSAACRLNLQDTEEVTMLQHIILSHHGIQEYGSPKEPLIPEAVLVFMLDYADSRLAALEKELHGTGKGTYTGPILAFDRRIFYLPKL